MSGNRNTYRLYVQYTVKGFVRIRLVRDVAAAQRAMLRLRSDALLKKMRADLLVRSGDRVVGCANQGDGSPCWIDVWASGDRSEPWRWEGLLG
jgi:hypothetical protein